MCGNTENGSNVVVGHAVASRGKRELSIEGRIRKEIKIKLLLWVSLDKTMKNKSERNNKAKC